MVTTLESPPDHKAIVLEPGPLYSLSSLSYHVAGTLKRFSKEYARGAGPPRAAWDLRGLHAGTMSMAALTAFLALAHRVRQFSATAPTAGLRWDPAVFGFLEDTGFLRIVDRLDLIRFPESILGGYGDHVGRINPATTFMYFPYESAPAYSDQQAWRSWKDANRAELASEIQTYAAQVFRPRRGGLRFPLELESSVTGAGAELAVNSILWGGVPAFIGIQRSPGRITFAVCDAGAGFLESLNDSARRGTALRVSDHVEGLLVGSVLNRREYGLRRLIQDVIRAGGWVDMWSYDAQVVWRQDNWTRCRYAETADEAISVAGPLITGRPPKEEGFRRRVPLGVRGVRVSFEIPLSPELDKPLL